MNLTQKIFWILFVALTTMACTETIEVQPMPAPWIMLQKGSSTFNYVYTTDTIIRRLPGQTIWRGDVMPKIISPAGIKEVKITKNEVDVPLNSWLTDRVNYTHEEYIPLSFTTNNESCVIKITATDMKEQVSSKQINVVYKW